MLHHLNDNEELFEKLVSSIREVRYFQRKEIQEIRMHPKKYDLLMSSCPVDLISLNTDGTVKFYGVPIVKAEIDRNKLFEIQILQ